LCLAREVGSWEGRAGGDRRLAHLPDMFKMEDTSRGASKHASRRIQNVEIPTPGMSLKVAWACGVSRCPSSRMTRPYLHLPDGMIRDHPQPTKANAEQLLVRDREMLSRHNEGCVCTQQRLASSTGLLVGCDVVFLADLWPSIHLVSSHPSGASPASSLLSGNHWTAIASQRGERKKLKDIESSY